MEVYAIVSGLIVLAFFTGYFLGWRKAAMEREELREYKSTYLRRRGWLPAYGEYDIRSFDGGKRWYAVEMTSYGMKIIDRAETVFPGLLEAIWTKESKLKEEVSPKFQKPALKAEAARGNVLLTLSRDRQPVMAIDNPRCAPHRKDIGR